MKLHEPFIISARLLPALQVGDVCISLAYNGLMRDRRMRYTVYLDREDGTDVIDDICSGVGGGSLLEGFSTLLSLLGAAAESYSYRLRTGRMAEHEDLFSEPVVEWAYQYADEIEMLKIEIEERPGLIEE